VGRFLETVESAAALPAGAPSGSTANGLFANLVASATSGFKLRRLTVGVRAGAAAPTSQQMTIAMVRTTARGTATTTNAPKALDPNLLQTSSLTGLDTAWSTVPTAASWAAPYLHEFSFNTQSGVDLPWELLEEFIVAAGAGNGLALLNVGNALPASHLYTVTIEHEE
jgi:hypothetical protein